MAEMATKEEVDHVLNDLHRHQDQDRQDIGMLRESVQRIDTTIAGFTGCINLIRWAIGIGVPTIVALLAAHTMRHW